MSWILFVERIVLFGGFVIVIFFYKVYLVKFFFSNIGNEVRRWRLIFFGVCRFWKTIFCIRFFFWRFSSVFFWGIDFSFLCRKTNGLRNVFSFVFFIFSLRIGTFVFRFLWLFWSFWFWWLVSSFMVDMFIG